MSFLFVASKNNCDTCQTMAQYHRFKLHLVEIFLIMSGMIGMGFVLKVELHSLLATEHPRPILATTPSPTPSPTPNRRRRGASSPRKRRWYGGFCLFS